MKNFVTASPAALQTGNHQSNRFGGWARLCARFLSIVVAGAVFAPTTHAATQTFPGSIKREVWSGAPSRQALYDGTLGAPSIVDFPTTFEAPSDFADNYTERLSGWFIPPTTGNYYFITSSDDDSDLFLSTDANPANKRLIAQQPGWNSTRNWPGDDGGATPEPQKNSQTYSLPDGTKPFAAGIPLTAGTPYYLEAVVHEGGGGDNLGVTAQLVGTAIPDAGADAAIPADQIALVYIVPTSFSVTISPGNTTAYAGTSVGFTANVTTDSDDTITYQWRENGVDVVGATGKNFSTQILSTSDNGLKVDVVVGLAHFPNTATSSQSTITVPATGEQVVTGYLKAEYFPGSNRTAVETGSVGAPAWTRNISSFETPVDFADNYAIRVSGYFIPAATGNYHFVVSSDDDSDLFVSTDSNAANKQLVAQQAGWNANREWSGDQGTAGTINPQRSSETWVPDPANPPAGGAPFAAGIPLTQGQKYYIEGVVHEGGGGDNFAVTFYMAGGTIPASGDAPLLTGNLIGYATSPATTLTISSQPQSATIHEGLSTNFTVVVTTDSAVQPIYQWRRNGVDIPGANSPTLGVTPSAADNNAKYSVVVSIPGSSLTVTSVEANLTVLTPVFAEGFLKWEYFDNETRGNVENGSAGTADQIRAVSLFEGPTNFDDNYASRISGFFVPAATDDYVFFIAADDDADLFLSTDSSPANKKLIAQEGGWSPVRSYNAVGGGSTIENKRSDQFGSPEWPDGQGGVTTTIHLTQGQRYYIEAVEHEGGGGDNLAVTVVTATEAAGGAPANGDAPTLTGARIGILVPPATVTITTQPASTVVLENTTATFTAAATTDGIFGPNAVSFQWRKNGVDVAGATSASYITPLVTSANNNDKYTVVVSSPGATPVTSSEATLTVNSDNVPPAIVSAGAVKRGTGFEIGIGFNEPLEAASAGVAANYTLSKGAVTAVRFEPYATPIDQAAPVEVKGAVVLETSGLAAGDNVTVTVTGVKDLKGNAIPAPGASKVVPISSKMTWVAVGGNEYLEGATPAGWDQDASKYYDNTVAIETDKDFDLISGGTANWDAYDEATFVYEEITGDFDRVVRVEYQDPSSQWARAGIMARTSLDEGVTRAAATSDSPMGAAIIVRVNPAVQWNGTAGNNAYEWVYREAVGGNYANSGGGGAPPYPDAWMRLQRAGTTFSAFRSSDGETWVNIGTRDWSAVVDATGNPVDKVFVGPYFAPELNNNESWRIGHSVVAKFRDYGPFQVVSEITIDSVTIAGNNVTIVWSGGGTLEWTSALTPGGIWTSTNDSDGSYTEPISTAQMKLFRVSR